MAKRASLILLPILLLGACNDRDADDANTPSTTAADDNAAATASLAPPDASGAAAGAALPLTGQAFTDAMAASDRFELESAKTVQAAGVTGAVRDFAQMMIRDHQKSSDELRMATGKVDKVKLDETPDLTAEQQSMLAELKGAAKDQVSAVYARQQVAAHEKALAMLQTYSQSGDAKPLMDFAGKTAAVVSQHLEHARRLP
jgi:putative membrane protein